MYKTVKIVFIILRSYLRGILEGLSLPIMS